MSDKIILGEIARRYFSYNPVKISRRLEGQGMRPDLCYQLGMRAYKEIEVNNLLHEMSHLAERETEKLLEFPARSWGFSLGKYWQIGTAQGFEPQTDQDVMREARVWSYQLSLSRELGVQETAKELVSSATWLGGFCLFKFRMRREGKVKSNEYAKGQEEALEILAQLVEEGTNIYTYQNFVENWNEKLEAIEAKRKELLKSQHPLK